MFRALLLSRDNDAFSAKVSEVDEAALPSYDAGTNVTVAVEYSTLNYKDGLAITNRSPVVRKWPMIAGVDAAGSVIASEDPKWQVGARVVLNGWGVGEQYWGGLAERARFKSEWLIALPKSISSGRAMALGTAGYTAMLCALALEDQGVRSGDVLVTGASGGVGSVAIAILKGRGFNVFASTGKTAEADYLKALGATEVIDRNTLSAPGKPLQKERWAAVVDTVGSHTLVNACAQTRYGGVVTACGLAQGMDFPASVAPFILRGVKLIGVDSVMAPLKTRERAWAALAGELDLALLDTMTTTIGLGESISLAHSLMDGKVRGRTLVDVNR